jgi:hypothetical protein
MALHAKAKAEAGYRFCALYDKISREDILTRAYARCRSNKGAPGIDGQDFADVEAYGVERWLGELALALKPETYRPDPIRRVVIPKANGKPRPLGISTLRDRVRMTAAMLVQGQTKQGRNLSTLAPLRVLRARAPDPAWARRVVDESVTSCPRAWCGKFARHVR